MNEPWLLVALIVASIALCAAGYAVFVVVTIPTNAVLHSVVRELAEHNESGARELVRVKRAFSDLEEDVQHHLEQATTRMKRAKSREATEKRTLNRQMVHEQPPDGAPREPTIDEQFAQAEREMWDAGGTH